MTVLFAQRAVAQTSAEVEARIARVEGGLTPPFLVAGRSYAPKRLIDVMREQHVPAVSIALINDGHVEWARSYGLADPASGRVATTETLFQAGSISKPVFAMAALSLVESGRLFLDEPVNARLRSWRIPSNEFTDGDPVTLRQLLTHTAGLTVHGFPGYERGKPLPTIPQVLNGTAPANTAAVVVNKRPGASFRYSGGGITVAQLLTTDVTGKPFPELMDELVLRPLGMTSSTYGQPLPARWETRAASGYSAAGHPVAQGYHTYPEMAAAGLWTTPTDLARWIMGLQDALAGRSQRVLKRTTAEAMITPGLDKWGLGIRVQGEGDSLRFEHGGANEGFQAQLIGFAARGQGVVVMTNSDAGPAVIAPLIQAIAAEYRWPGYEPKMIVAADVEPAALRELAGRYSLGSSEVKVTVGSVARSLELTLPSGQTMELIPQGADLFFAADRGLPLQFIRDPRGRPIGLNALGSKLTRIP